MTENTPLPTSSAYAGPAHYADADGTKIGGKRTRVETHHRAEAIRALVPTGSTVVYAIQLADGVIKIGCTADLPKRRNHYNDSEIIAFRLGDFDDEREIHAGLVPHRARGREYYHPAPEVLAVVNDMRDDFGLPHLAA